MRALAVLTIAATLALAAGTARAARFQVQPTRVELGGEHHTGSVTITNRSDAPVRFQVKAVAWSEDEDGVMSLVPTEELVVYPTLFTVDAGASRAVRLAAMAQPGDREVAYRIFVEELPPVRRGDAPAASRITMVTRMGIPVFLPAASPSYRGAVTAKLDAGGLAIRAHNTGASHVRIGSVRVRGDRGRQVAFDRSLAGWYLLAGRARRYVLPLSADDCDGLTRLRVEIATDRGAWRHSLDVAPGACGAR